MKLNYKVKPRIIMYKINEEKSCFLAQFFVTYSIFQLIFSLSVQISDSINSVSK